MINKTKKDTIMRTKGKRRRPTRVPPHIKDNTMRLLDTIGMTTDDDMDLVVVAKEEGITLIKNQKMNNAFILQHMREIYT